MLTTSINTFMAAHHKECDEIFARAEQSLTNGNWAEGAQQWAEFASELEKHFSREEQILFPEFESVTGMTGGPTQMMRIEHEQMRHLVSEISRSISNRDKDQTLGLTETLMITMQQHNMKEEQILYPMTDQALSNVASIVEKMSQH